MKVAALQINSNSNVDENLDNIKQWIERTKYLHNYSLLLLPENFAFMGNNILDSYAILEFQEKVEYFIHILCTNFNISIIAGGYPTLSGEKLHNTAAVFSDKGEIIQKYHKIHLFDSNPGDGLIYKESDRFNPGNSITIPFDIGEGLKGGLTICYDLRFPEMFRKLAQLGADVFFVPAAFTRVTGQAHWKTLLRARAIENTCYVVAAGLVGEHSNGRHTFGNSLIIDPWGDELSELGNSEGIVTAELCKDRIIEIRKKMPTLEYIQLI